MSNNPFPEALPRLILIADRFTLPDIAARVRIAVQHGIQWVHLRDHDADDITFASAAQLLIQALKEIREDVVISVNGRPEIAERFDLPYHGGLRRPAPPGWEGKLVGYSAHTLEEIAAQATRVDYLFYSPIFPTSSKPGHPGVGLGALAQASEHAQPLPLFALGGIAPAHCGSCLEAGAYGVAVISGILSAEDVASVVRAYNKELAPKECTR